MSDDRTNPSIAPDDPRRVNPAPIPVDHHRLRALLGEEEPAPRRLLVEHADAVLEVLGWALAWRAMTVRPRRQNDDGGTYPAEALEHLGEAVDALATEASGAAPVDQRACLASALMNDAGEVLRDAQDLLRVQPSLSLMETVAVLGARGDALCGAAEAVQAAVLLGSRAERETGRRGPEPALDAREAVAAFLAALGRFTHLACIDMAASDAIGSRVGHGEHGSRLRALADRILGPGGPAPAPPHDPREVLALFFCALVESLQGIDLRWETDEDAFEVFESAAAEGRKPALSFQTKHLTRALALADRILSPKRTST